MIRCLLLVTILTLAQFHFQDVKVATWTFGTPGKDHFERLSFWIKDEQRAYIRYSIGKDSDDVALVWLGSDSIAGKRGFRAGFEAPDNRTLFMAPVDHDSLLVFFRSGKDQLYHEKFHWENDTDSAAACDICAHSARVATGWLRKYFWK